MKRYITLLFLVIYCLSSNAQYLPTTLSNDKKIVTLDIAVYRKLTEKYYRCDTTILEKDSIIKIKGFEIDNLKQQIFFQQNLLFQKDTTIGKLNEVNSKTIDMLKKDNKNKLSVFGNTLAWVFAATGLFVGVMIAK